MPGVPYPQARHPGGIFERERFAVQSFCYMSHRHTGMG
jgi:hypothetical protein